MNKTFVMGNLGSDPETRFSTSGQKITTFSIATNVKKGAGKEDVTYWWKVTIFGDRFDKLLTYLKKGSTVIVTGELRPEIWTDKNGQPRLSLDIIADSINFGPSSRSNAGQEGGSNNYSGQQQQSGGYSNQSSGAPQSAENDPFGSSFGSYSGSTSTNANDNDLPF